MAEVYEHRPLDFYLRVTCSKLGLFDFPYRSVRFRLFQRTLGFGMGVTMSFSTLIDRSPVVAKPCRSQRIETVHGTSLTAELIKRLAHPCGAATPQDVITVHFLKRASHAALSGVVWLQVGKRLISNQSRRLLR